VSNNLFDLLTAKQKDIVQFVFNKLETAGYEAYIVGGAVRDLLLGHSIKDIDLTTNATPDEIKEVFKDYPIINNNGEKHGTVTVRYNEENIEITTYRIDGEYKDNRHPESVEFTKDIVKDLARRDFTINAMAYNSGDTVIDPFGGLKDLKEGIVRAVGDPKERFKEDALRILRGLRFACKYNFHIENGTMYAMFFQEDLLDSISAERIHDEIIRIFDYETVGDLMQGFMPGAIIYHIIPEFKYLNKQLFKLVTDHYVDNFIGICSYLTPEQTEAILTRLKFSTKDTKLIKVLSREVRKVNLDDSDSVGALGHRLVDTYGYSNKDAEWLVRKLLEIQDAFVFIDAINRYYFNSTEVINLVFESGCYSLNQLAVDGNDMIALGYKGKQIRTALEMTLIEVYSGILKNNKEDLIKFASDQTTRYNVEHTS